MMKKFLSVLQKILKVALCIFFCINIVVLLGISALFGRFAVPVVAVILFIAACFIFKKLIDKSLKFLWLVSVGATLAGYFLTAVCHVILFAVLVIVYGADIPVFSVNSIIATAISPIFVCQVIFVCFTVTIIKTIYLWKRKLK